MAVTNTYIEYPFRSDVPLSVAISYRVSMYQYIEDPWYVIIRLPNQYMGMALYIGTYLGNESPVHVFMLHGVPYQTEYPLQGFTGDQMDQMVISTVLDVTLIW